MMCAAVDYYTPDMIGVKVDCEVLGELIKLVCPAITRRSGG